MMILITNACGAGCSHCMQDSTPAGGHMPEETYLKALAFAKRTEAPFWSLMGGRGVLVLSGGEPTEHPDIARFIELAFQADFAKVLLLTNGLFLKNGPLRRSILRPEWPSLWVQVTFDGRFYPEEPPECTDPRIHRTESLRQIIPLGRVSRKRDVVAAAKGLPLKPMPGSFNVRVMIHEAKDFSAGVSAYRALALRGAEVQCSPVVTHEGYVHLGETRSCAKVGTVDSSNAELTKATLTLGNCNRCGLEAHLSPERKRAIGVT